MASLKSVLECVVNISEGRDRSTLVELAEVCGPTLLDQNIDYDHNRSVFTLAGPGPADAIAATVDLARAVASRLDLTNHHGVHPRLGALDVVPFCEIEGPMAIAVEAARAFGYWAGAELDLPVFFYDEADPEQRSLPVLRAQAFSSRAPDAGPSQPNPRLGAVAVGARRPLIAVNFFLASGDVTAAQEMAHMLRERDGGLPGVRALGFNLADRGCAQVSLNLTDLERTGLEQAAEAVERAAATANCSIGEMELIGLMPESEFARLSEEFVTLHRLSNNDTIEGRKRV